MGERAIQIETLSKDEYQELEAEAEVKHEFWGGQTVAMTGASLNHVILNAQISRLLNNHLDGTSCQAGGNDLKVKLQSSGDYVYPDIVVWCDDAQFDSKYFDTLLSPQVIVEILSPSTGRTDRDIKLECYRAIPSLTDYLLVSQQRVSIEHYSRSEDEAWTYRQYTRRSQSVRFHTLQVELSIAEIYQRLDVPEGLRLVDSDDF